MAVSRKTMDAITEMKLKLTETEDEIGNPSDPAQKAVKAVIPMMMDLLSVMRQMADHEHHDLSGGR